MGREKEFLRQWNKRRGWKRWGRMILVWTLVLAFLMPFFTPVFAYGKDTPKESLALDKTGLSDSGADLEKPTEEIQPDESELEGDEEKPEEGKADEETTDVTEEGKEDDDETDPADGGSGEKESAGETSQAETSPADDETETTEDNSSEENLESSETKEEETLEEETAAEKTEPEVKEDENEEKQEDGLCPHHTVHTEECGYIAPQDLECTHEPEENCDCKKEGSPCMYRCPFCIISWKWVDDEELLIWNEETNQWGLGLPGASEEMPVTRESLKEMLPGQIMAETAVGEYKIELEWDCDAFPEDGAWEGSYVLTAELDKASEGEEYVLKEAAGKLEVLVELGGTVMTDLPYNALALNEWTWEELGQGKDAVFFINVDEIDTTDKLIECLKKTVPKRIYGSGGKKDTYGPYTYDKVDATDEKKHWGYLKVDWSELENQIRNHIQNGEIEFIDSDVGILKPQQEFTIEAKKEVCEGITYYINDGWGGAGPGRLKFPILVKLVHHTVDSADPSNVKVNLFDYWVENYGENPGKPEGDILQKGDWHFRPKTAEAAENEIGTYAVNFSCKDQWNKGINEGHLLLFGDGVIHGGLWNKGAGENTQYGKKYAGMEQIVRAVLEDGYPVMNTAKAREIMMGVKDSDKLNYRDHTMIRDYRLAGDHIGTYDTVNADGNGGRPYEGNKIQNLSETVIACWGKDITNDTESLQYLFDPKVENDYKKSYTDVKGLFQLDDQGYYFYNMRENFAEFIEEADNNHIILYGAPATVRTDGKGSIGNFFPFNRGSEVFDKIDEGVMTSNVACSGNSMNHHMGMTVKIDFRQPAGGKIGTGSQQQPMTFGFSGDDDVWVFIDDVLVLDLGGVHSEIYGTIDFSDGTVCIGRAFDTHGIPANPEDPANLVRKTDLETLYKEAGREKDFKWNHQTFASNTSHTLKMFYLERGNYDSSIALRFNLQPLLYQQIRKVDQNGNPVEGVEFQLYPAEKVNDGSDGIQCFYTDGDTGSDIFYVKETAGKDALVTLTTNADGTCQFLMEDGSYFNFADRGEQYYILKETIAPKGYRKQPEDIVLRYDPNTSMLSVANRWTTGAYACSVVNITGSTDLKYGDFNANTANNITIDAGSTSVDNEDQKNGLVVAVPILAKRSDKSWLALYGNNLQGFHSVEIKGQEKESWKKAILMAALRQAGNGYADWHLEWDDGNKRLKGMINDLPGLASRYLLNNEKGDMQMIYGIISPDALSALSVSGVNAGERYQALGTLIGSDEKEAGKVRDAILRENNGFSLLDARQFIREFRSLIYIPNERRELRVQKVDQDGKPVEDAEFGLYRDSECTDLAVSGKTDKNGMLVFSPTADGAVAGQAKMEWASGTNSVNTHYYLQEKEAPSGYIRNNTIIPIVVGIYSIYADAGTEGDGVKVMAGVGRLTQTMHQYAIGGDVDITLQDITATMQTQPSGSFEPNGWEDVMLEGTPEHMKIVRSMNLHYGKNTTRIEEDDTVIDYAVDYGLHDKDGGKLYRPYFITDTGYVRTRVKQNYEALTSNQYGESQIDVNKDDLGDADLTNLFSLLNVVVVTDRTQKDTDTGTLTISKKLIGENLSTEDYSKNFTFTLQLYNPDKTPLEGKFKYYFYGKDKTGYVSGGEKLVLHHGESITILGLPAGTRFTVTEASEENWYVKPKDGICTGEIVKDKNSEAGFLNSRKPFPDDPKDPKDPKDPETPTNPDNPTHSGGSEDPGTSSRTPRNPREQKGPGIPEPTAAPTEPANPAEQAIQDDLNRLGDPNMPRGRAWPSTGDTSNADLWLIIGGLSLGGVIFIWFTKLRRKRKD